MKTFTTAIGIATLLIAVALGAALLAQPPQAIDATGPKFDVASIKRNKPGEGPQYTLTKIEPGGRLIATGAQLRTLIAMAYQLKPDETKLVTGLPDWAKAEAFDVEGRADGDPPREQLDLMLQALLADRFKLVMHRETRQAAVYALVVARNGKLGPNLQRHSETSECLKIQPGQPVPLSDFGVNPPPPPACGRFISGAHRLAGNNVTIDALVANLGAMESIDRPVINRTGLTGGFDLNLEYTPQLGQGPDANSDPSAPPSIFTALQEQFGLRLEPATGPINLIIIDHVERPSEN